MIEPVKLKELLKNYIHDLETHEANFTANRALEKSQTTESQLAVIINQLNGLIGRCDLLERGYAVNKEVLDNLVEQTNPIILKHYKKSIFK